MDYKDAYLNAQTMLEGEFEEWFDEAIVKHLQGFLEWYETPSITEISATKNVINNYLKKKS